MTSSNEIVEEFRQLDVLQKGTGNESFVQLIRDTAKQVRQLGAVEVVAITLLHCNKDVDKPDEDLVMRVIYSTRPFDASSYSMLT